MKTTEASPNLHKRLIAASLSGVALAGFAAACDKSPTPTPNTAAASCPAFERATVNPDALPHGSGTDVRISGMAEYMLGSFESWCTGPNVALPKSVLAVGDNGYGGVTLRETVYAKGGSYEESLTLKSTWDAEPSTIVGFEVADSKQITTSSYKAHTSVDATIKSGTWNVTMSEDGTTSPSNVTSALNVAQGLLHDMVQRPPVDIAP
ncbi:MAG TPA: hypothetical protein VIM53_02725 [Candidatus Saccharimonadales bacterium]